MTLQCEDTSATLTSLTAHPILYWTLVHLENSWIEMRIFQIKCLYRTLEKLGVEIPNSSLEVWNSQAFKSFNFQIKNYLLDTDNSWLCDIFYLTPMKFWKWPKAKRSSTRYPKFSARRFIREKGEASTLFDKKVQQIYKRIPKYFCQSLLYHIYFESTGKQEDSISNSFFYFRLE